MEIEKTPGLNGPSKQVAYEVVPSDQGMVVREVQGPQRSFTEFLGDLVDVINPLQHIPIVSTAYRAITGDQISDGARLAGNVLYGGPIGLIFGAINTAVANETGKDIGGHALALFGGSEEGGKSETRVFAQAPEPAGAAPDPDSQLAEFATAAGQVPADSGNAQFPNAQFPIAQAPIVQAPIVQAPIVQAPAPEPYRPASLPNDAPPQVPPSASLMQPQAVKDGAMALTEGRFMPIDKANRPKATNMTKSVPLEGSAGRFTESSPRARELLKPAEPKSYGPVVDGMIATGKFMPLPAEPASAAEGDQAPPAPAEAKKVSEADAVNKAAAALGIANQAHPLLNPGANDSEFLSRAMQDALEKYRKTAKLAG